MSSCWPAITVVTASTAMTPGSTLGLAAATASEYRHLRTFIVVFLRTMTLMTMTHAETLRRPQLWRPTILSSSFSSLTLETVVSWRCHACIRQCCPSSLWVSTLIRATPEVSCAAIATDITVVWSLRLSAEAIEQNVMSFGRDSQWPQVTSISQSKHLYSSMCRKHIRGISLSSNVWLGSLTVTCQTCNPEVIQRRRFDSVPGHCRVTTLGNLFTHTKQYNLVPVKGRWCPEAGKVTVGLASHWPCATDSWSIHLQAQRSRVGDEHPDYAPAGAWLPLPLPLPEFECHSKTWFGNPWSCFLRTNEACSESDELSWLNKTNLRGSFDK